MVKVCDAIMGTGKSSAAITYMNEHSDERFIYITPYLDEAARIKKQCPACNFVEPSDKLSKYNYKKSLHTAALISQGKCIATTHQAFKSYTNAMLMDIQKYGYILIIDENVDVLEAYDLHPDDLKMTVDGGYVEFDKNAYSLTGKPYDGAAMRDLFNMMKSRSLICVQDGDSSLFYWALPPELITSFKQVFVLTYLFTGQSFHHFLEIYDIEYEYIGIEKQADGTFRFCDWPGYTPEYVSNLRDKLHIYYNDKLNEIGDDYYSLSLSWFERDGDGVEQLKKNVYNFYRNICGTPAAKRLWGSYKAGLYKIRGKGYSNAFLNFNARATNKYRDRNTIVYACNVFMNVREKTFYQMHGIDVDEDVFALSTMVQWIWRSAIRDGEEVILYVPSRRMRTLLENWIDSLSEGGNADV